MPTRDPVLTPELIKILKIFIFSSFGLVLVFSFFNTYRADNTGQDRTFNVPDADRLYFLNVRSIYYDREVRSDAGMTLFRHSKRMKSDSLPSFDPVIILNPIKDDGYIFFELQHLEYPVSLQASSDQDSLSIEFSNGNNQDHLKLMNQLKTWIDANYQIVLKKGSQSFPLWSTEKEKDVFKTIAEDYFRLINKAHN
jgi:hypothetical protein